MFQKQPHWSNYNLRGSLALSPSQQEAIEELLTTLMQQIPARFILLADVTGQVISIRGEQREINVAALGSLVAGVLSICHEIARLAEQYQTCQMVVQEGQTSHLFICEAGRRLVILAQVSTKISLGWARIVIRKAARQLADLTAAPLPQKAQQEVPWDELTLQPIALPDSFNDTLDDLWLE